MAFLLIPAAPIALIMIVKTAEKFAIKSAKRPGKWLLGESFDPSKFDPVDCVPGTWDANWSACDATCGGGTQVLKRRNDIQPRNGGGACPAGELHANCNMQRCPTDCEPSGYSIIPELPPGEVDWTERTQGWTRCDSEACGLDGYQYKYRDTQYDIEGTPDGKKCLSDEEKRICSTPCPDPADFLTLLSPDNVHSSTLSGSILNNVLDQLHTGGNGWHMVSFVYKNPGTTSKEMVMRTRRMGGGYSFIETDKRPDGTYRLHIGTQSGLGWGFGMPILQTKINNEWRGANRYIVIGLDAPRGLVTILFVPFAADMAAGVKTEKISYYREDPYM
jgi:hypothetical protein